jgi:hypothetical protein
LDKTYWLSRMDAAVDAALSAPFAEDCLDNLFEAGLCSVRARACATQVFAGKHPGGA